MKRINKDNREHIHALGQDGFTFHLYKDPEEPHAKTVDIYNSGSKVLKHIPLRALHNFCNISY